MWANDGNRRNEIITKAYSFSTDWVGKLYPGFGGNIPLYSAFGVGCGHCSADDAEPVIALSNATGDPTDGRSSLRRLPIRDVPLCLKEDDMRCFLRRPVVRETILSEIPDGEDWRCDGDGEWGQPSKRILSTEANIRGNRSLRFGPHILYHTTRVIQSGSFRCFPCAVRSKSNL
jgi:hypothetical protein